MDGEESSIHASASTGAASTQLSEKATHVLLPSAIQLLQLVIKHPSRYSNAWYALYNFSAERTSLTVARLRLDVLSEHEPGQETDRETAVTFT